MSDQEHEALRGPADSIEWGDDPLSVNGRIATEHGLRFNAVRRERARWVAGRIR
ncbi:hypothetical protein ACFXEL_22310 [Streptomyces sp. NPDC059382]|uniref:hypothetical protein n=1 Tax=unclassified Streptomyces TaxID=2593676 RepID=UPI00331BD99B